MVAAVVFEVVQERGDQRRVEVGDVQRVRFDAGALLGEHQQPERVAVGGECAGWPVAARSAAG
jgi:hypothetical protein